jgi:trimeric autotransporter adhesin
MPRRILITFVLLSLLTSLPAFLLLKHTQATNLTASDQLEKTSIVSEQLVSTTALTLAQFLNADGSLNLPPEGILGSINPTGFEMVSNPGEVPRFAPTEVVNSDDANWDDQFYEAAMNGAVRALAWDGTSLYAGGEFIAAGLCANCNHIARWDGVDWRPLDSGVNDTVHALVWTGADLIVGGRFNRLCANSACSMTVPANGVNRIARWDGAAWRSLDSGLDSPVYALAWDNGNLYVGGAFTRSCANVDCSTVAAANGINFIARWTGTDWHSLDQGLDNAVLALTLDGTDVYVGGAFAHLCADTDCAAIHSANGVNRIARWDGASWHPLQNGLSGGWDVSVRSLVWDGTDLYVGGQFNRLCNNADCSITEPPNGVNNNARWDGDYWYALDNGLRIGIVNAVYSMIWDGTGLIVGGSFNRLCANADCSSYSDPSGVFHIARWNGVAWQSLDNGLTNQALALVWKNDGLTVGGRFRQTCGDSNCSTIGANVNHIAQWDGFDWSVVSDDAEGQALNGAVATLVWDGMSLYAGGFFTAAGLCEGCNRIARWDGVAWHPLGYGLNGTVRALAWDGVSLYAAGGFRRVCANANCTTVAPANGVNFIARWDGAHWHPLGNGLYGSALTALAWSGADLYVAGGIGGLCTNADCTDYSGANGMNRVARWDGTNWHPLGNGLITWVNVLAWDGESLYAGGEFSRVCTTPDCLPSSVMPATGVNRIARWDGTNWHPLGNGLNAQVNSLIWNGTSLYVGGGFTRLCANETCSTPHLPANGINRIARWDGTNWHPLDQGVSGSVLGLAWDGANLYVGGGFERLCNNVDCTDTGVMLYRTAYWNGQSWHPLGSGVTGVDFFKSVRAMAWDGASPVDSVYVGGEFIVAGGNSSARIGRWLVKHGSEADSAIYLPMIVR